MKPKTKEQALGYLPELRDKIAPVFKRVMDEQFLDLTLDETSQYDLKQILKFLLSSEPLDNGTKRLEEIRVRKDLISYDQRERRKGQLILSVLRRLDGHDIANTIIANTSISQGTIDLITESLSTEESQKECLKNIQHILDTLNENDSSSHDIKKEVSQYIQHLKLRVSTGGDAVEFILKFSEAAKKDSSRYDSSNGTNIFHDDVFVYAGDLVEKLERVKSDTWRKLVSDKSIKNLICFYKQPLTNIVTGQPLSHPRYRCKTLQEVLALAETTRSNYEQTKKTYTTN